MDDKNMIMILLGVIIVILIVGIVIVAPMMAKEDCQLTVKDKSIYAGDRLALTLTDLNGNAISDETIHVKLESDSKTITKDIKTNSKGTAKLKLKSVGNYKTECKFDGNNEFKSVSNSFNVKVKNASTSYSTGSDSPHSITVVPEFDKDVSKTVGEYTLKATKWRGSGVGGFGVFLYKNGQLLDRNSYQSRAYFCMDGEWKWSNWDNGEEDAVYHKYPVSNDVEIREVEVSF